MYARKFMHQCPTSAPPPTTQPKSPLANAEKLANSEHRPSLATAASVAAAVARHVSGVSSRVSPVSSPKTPATLPPPPPPPPSPTLAPTSVFGTFFLHKTPGKVKFIIRAAMATFAVGVYVVVLVLCQNVHGYPSLKVNRVTDDIYSQWRRYRDTLAGKLC